MNIPPIHQPIITINKKTKSFIEESRAATTLLDDYHLISIANELTKLADLRS